VSSLINLYDSTHFLFQGDDDDEKEEDDGGCGGCGGCGGYDSGFALNF
jgi:hypothetical protein